MLLVATGVPSVGGRARPSGTLRRGRNARSRVFGRVPRSPCLPSRTARGSRRVTGSENQFVRPSGQFRPPTPSIFAFPTHPPGAAESVSPERDAPLIPRLPRPPPPRRRLRSSGSERRAPRSRVAVHRDRLPDRTRRHGSSLLAFDCMRCCIASRKTLSLGADRKLGYVGKLEMSRKSSLDDHGTRLLCKRPQFTKTPRSPLSSG